MTTAELLVQTIETAGLPIAYGAFFEDAQDPPFCVYLGNGEEQFYSDNGPYYSYRTYQLEYYFKTKNEDTEDAITSALLSAGFRYERSQDVYIESENLFVIYFTIWRI